MSIKMRTNNKSEVICENCLKEREKAIEMFDLKIGESIITICDECNSKLFNKTLTVVCNVNAKLKSPNDMKIINARNRKKNKNDRF